MQFSKIGDKLPSIKRTLGELGLRKMKSYTLQRNFNLTKVARQGMFDLLRYENKYDVEALAIHINETIAKDPSYIDCIAEIIEYSKNLSSVAVLINPVSDGDLKKHKLRNKFRYAESNFFSYRNEHKA